ncbi:AAA family ATPase [Pseudonocardiaceae bacterium YIM PH 21723]|nr:AAA family ATPase [Pseudonocardiaceae bacterium YIM PH 21723]
MAEAVRISLLLRLCMEVLRDKGPLTRRETMDEIRTRFEPTEYEAGELSNGRVRWENSLAWHTGDATTIGWIEKSRGKWALADDGAKALAAYPGDELIAELTRQYTEIRRQRTTAAEQMAGKADLVSQALALIPPGSWTSFHDLGQLVEEDPMTVANFLAHVRTENGHRVALPNGSLPGANLINMWFRGGDLDQKLTKEGVTFVDGKLSPDRRLNATDLRGLMSSTGRRAWLLGSGYDIAAGFQGAQFGVGDYALKVIGQGVLIGRIMRVDSNDTDIHWLNDDRPLFVEELDEGLRVKLRTQSPLVELTDELEAIEALLSDEPSVVQHQAASLPDIQQDRADKIMYPKEWLQNLVDLLSERKQIILYGPPGTGKTFLADKLAEQLTEPSAIKLVQFHPSFSYEDFFEGFRPTPGEDGKVTFAKRPGALRVLVDAARKKPLVPHILIIDEINRANLPKVFGELYFSLEYRERPITLMYSPDEADFTLPDNLFVIGTMNTSDRSIAQVDAAIRRRFDFVELHPQKEPVDKLLDNWLAELTKRDQVKFNKDAPEMLRRLNKRITDWDLRIGPSYLMRKEIYQSENGLERVWKHSIMPLLAEHTYGQGPDALLPFGLKALGAQQ